MSECCNSAYLSVRPIVHKSVRPSIHLSIHSFIHPPFKPYIFTCLSPVINLSIYLSNQSLYLLSDSLPICPSIRFVRPPIFPSIHPSFRASIYSLSINLFICLSNDQFVCLFLSELYMVFKGLSKFCQSIS